MADLIDRAALFADMEGTLVISGRPGDSGFRNVNKIIGRIKAAPAVDAVEVVRCKDCMYFKIFSDGYTKCAHRHGMAMVLTDGFCSYGERKDEKKYCPYEGDDFDCQDCPYGHEEHCHSAVIADHLISHGVTFATDNNVACKKPMTNADRIRAMSDEELAKFLDDCNSHGCVCPARDCRPTCHACIVDWLKEPAEVDNE